MPLSGSSFECKLSKIVANLMCKRPFNEPNDTIDIGNDKNIPAFLKSLSISAIFHSTTKVLKSFCDLTPDVKTGGQVV
jgi:hypothetical protein